MLREKKLVPLVPTCSQLEEKNEKQLTVEKTNESRMVSKVSEIEKYHINVTVNL